MDNLNSNNDSLVKQTSEELAKAVGDAQAVDMSEEGNKKRESEIGPGVAPTSGDRTRIRIFHGRPGGGTTSFGGTVVDQG